MKNISVMYCIRNRLHMDSISIFVEFTYTGAVGLVTCIVLSTHPPSYRWNVRNLRALPFVSRILACGTPYFEATLEHK